VDAAPPLTAEQGARLWVLLRPVAVDASKNVTTDGDMVKFRFGTTSTSKANRIRTE
jgi:hypothetical protein